MGKVVSSIGPGDGMLAIEGFFKWLAIFGNKTPGHEAQEGQREGNLNLAFWPCDDCPNQSHQDQSEPTEREKQKQQNLAFGGILLFGFIFPVLF